MQARRTYRLDRITALTSLPTPAARPEDLDVEHLWGSVVDEVEQHRSRVTAVVLTAPYLVGVLTDRLGRHVQVVADEDDGRVRIAVSSHTARSVAEHLAGFGAAVEVLEPADVRAELATLGAELVARYGMGARSPDEPERTTARTVR